MFKLFKKKQEPREVKLDWGKVKTAEDIIAVMSLVYPHLSFNPDDTDVMRLWKFQED